MKVISKRINTRTIHKSLKDSTTSSKDRQKVILQESYSYKKQKIQIICILLDYNGNQAKDHNPSNVLFIKGSGLFIQESFKRPIHPRNEMPDYSSKDQRNPDNIHLDSIQEFHRKTFGTKRIHILTSNPCMKKYLVHQGHMYNVIFVTKHLVQKLYKNLIKKNVFTEFSISVQFC